MDRSQVGGAGGKEGIRYQVSSRLERGARTLHSWRHELSLSRAEALGINGRPLPPQLPMKDMESGFYKGKMAKKFIASRLGFSQARSISVILGSLL